MKARWPCSSRERSTGSRRTVWRRLRYQYSASSSAVSISSPVTVEWKGISPLGGEIGAKASSSSSSKRLDLGRVGGVVDGDRLGADAVFLAGRLQLPQRLGLAGDDQRGGAVDRGQGESLAEGLEAGLELLGGERDREHAALAGELGHRLAAQGDDAGRRPRARARRRCGRRRSPPGSGRPRPRARPRSPRQSLARETIAAKRAGWTMSRRSSHSPCSSRRTSLERPIDEGGERLLALAACGGRRPVRSRAAPAPCPACWAPWPAKRKAGPCSVRALPLARPGASSPAARAPRASSSCSRSSPSATARCSKLRPGGGQGVGDVGGVELGVCLAGGRRGARPGRAGRAPTLAERSERDRAGEGRAARRRGSLAEAPAPGRGPACRLGAGASSKIRWALVPLMPKEETAGAARAPVRLPGLGLAQAARPPPPPSRPWRRARRRAGSSAAPPRASPSPS